MIRARVGDVVELSLTNTDPSGNPHNIDCHGFEGTVHFLLIILCKKIYVLFFFLHLLQVQVEGLLSHSQARTRPRLLVLSFFTPACTSITVPLRLCPSTLRTACTV